MKTYTVLLLYPDYLAENYGEETYMTSVEAPDVPSAIEQAQAGAANDNGGREEVDPDDFRCLCVIAGEHDDIKDQGRKVAVQTPLYGDPAGGWSNE